MWSNEIGKRNGLTLDAKGSRIELEMPNAAPDLQTWWTDRGLDVRWFVAIHDEYQCEVQKFEKLLDERKPTLDTIHNWRRQVSHFYRYLALLRKDDLLSKEFALEPPSIGV